MACFIFPLPVLTTRHTDGLCTILLSHLSPACVFNCVSGPELEAFPVHSIRFRSDFLRLRSADGGSGWLRRNECLPVYSWVSPCICPVATLASCPARHSLSEWQWVENERLVRPTTRHLLCWEEKIRRNSLAARKKDKTGLTNCVLACLHSLACPFNKHWEWERVSGR